MSNEHKHYIRICKECSRTLAQCRCIDVKRTPEYGVCGSCKKIDAGLEKAPVAEGHT